MDVLSYKITLKKGGFEVTVEGDKDWVESKFKELTSSNSIVPTQNIPVENTGIAETLGEFLDSKGNPERHTDVIAVFAYWYFKKQGLQSFNVKDIIVAYDKTRKPKPSNPNMIINQNVATHIFAEANEKKDNLKAWVITRTGESYVEQLGGSN